MKAPRTGPRRGGDSETHNHHKRQSAKGVKPLRVRCVLFDLDGTLYESREYSKRLEEEIVRFVSEELHLDEQTAKSILDDRRKKIGTLTRTIESLGIDRKSFYQTIAERIEPRQYISPNNRTRNVIKELRKEGLRIGLVSNSGRELVNKILSALELRIDWFDVIVTSTEVEPKPSAEPFLLALRQIGCSKVNAVYVGDREEAEIRPARQLGLKTVLVSKDGEPSSWADVVVREVSELRDVLRRERD